MQKPKSILESIFLRIGRFFTRTVGFSQWIDDFNNAAFLHLYVFSLFIMTFRPAFEIYK